MAIFVAELGLALGFVACPEYGVLPSDDLPQPLFDAMTSVVFFSYTTS
ncbi:MAG: hypothetical protein H6750_18500 [Nitrospiraceae bacterium]|nr:hypothetical protein [Nitrospiraceae bacterium]